MKFLDPKNAKLDARFKELKEQRDHSWKKIREKRPLDAETDNSRKIRRIKTVAKVDEETARKVAQYENMNIQREAIDAMPLQTRFGAERILGESRDFVSVSFLEFGQAAACSVGRVVSSVFSPLGSGFKISDSLFITNNHVIKNSEEAGDLYVEFDYELGIDSMPKTVTRFRFNPQTFFDYSVEDDLDYTIVAIGDRVGGNRDLEEFGFCPITDLDSKHVLGECANIIQHPQGRYKEVVLRKNQLSARNEEVLQYFSDTENGSSGAPVYNNQWETIGLHHYGTPSRYADPVTGTDFEINVNEGIRISAIVKDLREKINESRFDEAEQQILEEALNYSSSYPSLTKPRAERIIGKRYESPASESVAKFTIPLEISIKIDKLIR